MDQYQIGFTSQFEHLQQRFERIEDRMDQQQATFEHIQQRIERIESRQESQHEEMMAAPPLLVSTSTSSALILSRPHSFRFDVTKGGEKFRI